MRAVRGLRLKKVRFKKVMGAIVAALVAAPFASACRTATEVVVEVTVGGDEFSASSAGQRRRQTTARTIGQA